MKEQQRDGHQRAGRQVEGSARTWVVLLKMASVLGEESAGSHRAPRSLGRVRPWVGTSVGLSGAGLGQWARGIQRQLGYPTWGRGWRDLGSGFALRWTGFYAVFGLRCPRTPKGRAGARVMGSGDPRGKWGPG